MSLEEVDQSAGSTAGHQTQFALLLNSSQSIAWLASVDPFQIVDLNPGAQKVVQRSDSANGSPRSWIDVVHPDDRARFEEALEFARQQGTTQLKYRTVSSSGEISWLRDNISFVAGTGETPALVGGIAVDVTAEEEEHLRLQESKAILETLVDDLPMNVVRKDLHGRIVFANQRFCDSLQRGLHDLIGKTDFDLYPAELAKKYTDDDRNVLESGQAMEDFEEHLAGDGKKTFVQVLKGPVRSEDGEPIGLQIMFWDATDRKEAEAQLERERYLLHALMDGVSDSIYFKDADSRFIRVSRGLAKKFGLPNEDAAVGKTDADFFSEEHAQAALEDERAIMHGGAPILAKEERETWDGERETWCLTTKMALHDPNGNVVGTFGISRDITEKKRSKAQLARERDLLKTIIDNVPNQIFVKDRAGRFILANAAILKQLGVSSIDEVIGKTDYDFSPAELACEYVADDQIVMRGGEPLIDQEETTQGPNKEEICLLTSRVPLRRPDGEIIGLVGIGQDITDRKREQETLQNALKIAKNASQAKSDFLANMSHEIRTPLNAIIGMTALVLDTELTDTQQEFLSMIKESGNTLLSVINDILDFSKIEAGKLELDPVEFDLRDQLGNTMKSLAFRAHGKNLELTFRVDPAVPSVFCGDIGRLRQIIVNLVANGVKFTDEGEVRVEVHCKALTDETAHLQFSVSDTGIGIPKEKCATIFREFEQADTSTTRSYGGTGLGLAISTSLVELMGGKIWVESQIGRGSTFHFSVGLQIGSVERLPKPPVVVGGTSVLIVDDSETNRLILEEMVKGWGMMPRQADSVSAAQVAMQDAADAGKPIELVLSDLNMPEQDGLKLAEWMQSKERLSQTPFILLTSGGSDEQTRRHEFHVAGKLAKPIKQAELFDSIVRVLGLRGPTEDRSSIPASRMMSRPLRILLAEDSVFNQRLAVALLEKEEHNITVVENGYLAVEISGVKEFDLILMDVQMPEMDGLDATREIRKREKELSLPRIPIIAMTAHAFKGDREQCLDAGMDDYVAKPIDPDRLFEAIAAVADTSAVDPNDFVLDYGNKTDEKEAPTQSHNDVFDLQAALLRVRGSEDTLKSLARIMVEECPKLLSGIAEAAENHDGPALRRHAHTLKGSAGHFAAEDLVAAAAAMEELGTRDDFEEVPDALSELRRQVSRLEDAIRKELRI